MYLILFLIGISIICIIIALVSFLYGSKINEKLKDIKKYFKIIGYVLVSLLVLLIIVRLIKVFLVSLFPSIMPTLGLKTAIETHLFAVGVMLIVLAFYFVVRSALMSRNGDFFISIAVKIAIGALIILLAYWIYPDGILDTAIANLTLGVIGRLIIVIILGGAFFANVSLLIHDIRDLNNLK